jgi:multidrug resistance efflux pump
MFTLIDARTWWAIGNFREGLLKRIAPGMKGEVYVMTKPDVRFEAIVDSVGFGVTPDPDRIGRLGPGLSDVQRTLNWVHLASRYQFGCASSILRLISSGWVKRPSSPFAGTDYGNGRTSRNPME